MSFLPTTHPQPTNPTTAPRKTTGGSQRIGCAGIRGCPSAAANATPGRCIYYHTHCRNIYRRRYQWRSASTACACWWAASAVGCGVIYTGLTTAWYTSERVQLHWFNNLPE